MHLPIYQKSFDIETIRLQFPPHLSNSNKRFLFNYVDQRASCPSGEIAVSCWNQMDLPDNFPIRKLDSFTERIDSFYAYDPPCSGTTNWHVNFAHQELFGFYGTPLFAQDEL